MKLMLVDDEPLVRYGMKQAIPWEKGGFQIVAEAGDGQTALMKAIQCQPDIIICDIRMPTMDGIAFVQKLKQYLPQVHTVMLTAYAEKEYMLQAIRCGVSDFLLKPAGFDQIYQTVCKVRDTIENEKKAKAVLEQRSELLEENADFLRDYYIQSLLKGNQPPERILKAMEIMRIPLPGPTYSILAAFPLPGQEWLLRQTLLSTLAPFSPVVTHMQADRSIVLVLNSDFPEQQPLIQSIEQVLPDIKKEALKPFILSDTTSHLEELAQAYDKLSFLAKHTVWLDTQSLLLSNVYHISTVNEAEINHWIERLVKQVGTCSSESLHAVAMQLFNELTVIQLSQPDVTHVLKTLENALNLRHNLRLDLQDLTTMSVTDARDAFAKRLVSQNVRRTFGSGHVGRALRYIQQHYQEELSLESVAKALYLSPTYLSRILNEKTERGFIGWLRFFRIQSAKELLNTTDNKHYEIAEAVGYHSYKVFSEHFLEETGLTISNWKTQNESSAKSD